MPNNNEQKMIYNTLKVECYDKQRKYGYVETEMERILES